MVAAPAVVGSIAIGGQRAAKVRRRKSGDIARHTQLHRGVVKRGHGVADLGQQAAVLRDQVVVQVKAPKRDQEHLPFCTQAGACTNEPGHHFELIGERVAARKNRPQRHARKARSDLRLGPDGACGHLVVFVLQRVGARLLDQPCQRGFDCAGAIHVVLDRVDGHRAAGADLVGQGTVARQKHGIASDVDAGKQGIGVAGQRQVAHVAAPANGGALGRRRLPDRLLVIVGKQLGWQGIVNPVRATVLGLGQWNDERAHIELHGSFAAVEQVGQTGHGRVQRILAPTGQRSRWVEQGRRQICLGQRYAAGRLARTTTAYRAIQVVAGVVIGDHGVCVVVGTVEKHTDQGFVIGRIKRRRFSNGGQVEGHWQRSATQRQLRTATQEVAPTVVVDLEQVHGCPYF